MIDELPEGRDPATDTPQVFSQKAAAMVLAQRALPAQINAAIAGLSSMAAGGAYAFAYGFDPSDAVGDPGPGRLRLNANAQNAATILRIDPITGGGVNIDSVFTSIGAGTSVVKGAIRIVKVADPTRWLLFDILSVTASSGYQAVAVTPRGSSSSSPFVSSDSLMVYIDRAGDLASGAEVLLGGADITEATPLINFLNIFSSLYDNYRVEMGGIATSSTNMLQAKLAVAGVPAPGYSANNNFGTSGSGGGVLGQTGLCPAQGGRPRTLTLEIKNVNSSAPKLIQVTGGYESDTSGTFFAVGSVTVFASASIVSGFQLLLNGGNYTGGRVRVYGRRN
jgi:hypothetical protein